MEGLLPNSGLISNPPVGIRLPSLDVLPAEKMVESLVVAVMKRHRHPVKSKAVFTARLRAMPSGG
jgi:hypothetical protein